MLNTLIAEGRLVKDPTLKKTDGNFVYSWATLASKRGFKNQETGEYESDFIQLYLTQDRAKNFAKLCHQGDLVSIVGRLQTERRKTKEGEVSYYTNVFVSEFHLLTKKKTQALEPPHPACPSQEAAPFSLGQDPLFDTNIETMHLPPTVDF